MGKRKSRIVDVASRSIAQPRAVVPLPTLYEDFQKGIAHCLTCGSTGAVETSKVPGESGRIIRWDNGTEETWHAASVPSTCDACYERRRKARNHR